MKLSTFLWKTLAGYKPLLLPLLLSVFLFIIRALSTWSLDFGFLLWNLLLGAVPLLWAVLLVGQLRKSRWLHWKSIILTFLWLSFLPNSFYIVTDFIHLQRVDDSTLIFDIVYFFSCTVSAYTFGYASLYLVHKQLEKRFKQQANYILACIIALCSFAVYLGRYLRWNTWDIVAHPNALVFDVSEQFFNPSGHPEALIVTFTFFVLISSLYIAIYQILSKSPKTSGRLNR